MRCLMLAICLALSSALPPAARAQEPKPAPPKVHSIAVGGDGGWDYLSVDADARRLYVSRGNKVVVLDLDKEAVVGELTDTPGVHGIAIAPGHGKGFTSNGGNGTVTIFDLKTLKPTGKAKASGTPDAILFDPASDRVFTLNHGTNDTTAINPTDGTVIGTLALGGEPEGAVADGKGHLFINLRSTSEIAEVDARTLKILNRWPLAPGTRPTGLAIDTEHRRLFSVCGNQKMVVMDADTGAVLDTLEIGRGADGCMFDQAKGRAYSSNGGDGTVTVVGESKPGKYQVIANIPTKPSARTMTLDPKTHRLYLSAATPLPAPAAGQPQTRGPRGSVPGSFQIIVVGD